MLDHSVELRNQLNQESDAARQLGLRREFEGKNYQDRIDKLVCYSPFHYGHSLIEAQTSDYSTTRESLIAAKTSQEHLERRVADLVSQVTTREEKLAVYEGRTTSDSTDPNLTAEQQLEIEVVALKFVQFLSIRISRLTVSATGMNSEYSKPSSIRLTSTYNNFNRFRLRKENHYQNYIRLMMNTRTQLMLVSLRKR